MQHVHEHHLAQHTICEAHVAAADYSERTCVRSNQDINARNLNLRTLPLDRGVEQAVAAPDVEDRASRQTRRPKMTV
jgi:hypothetical protein